MTALATGSSLDAADRVALHERYRRIRDLTEDLAAPLSDEDQVVQSMPDVSPTKWHRAHTTWFFETFLLTPRTDRYAAFDPAYAYLFNSYYEAVGPRHPRPHRGLLSRPSVHDIARYRAHVDVAMHELIDDCDADAAALVELGLNHEQQHQELLLMDIKHVLHCNPTDPVYAGKRSAPSGASPFSESPFSESPFSESPLRFVAVPGGNAEIGHDGRGFSFDNECPRHVVHLEPMHIADRLVCAREWLAFIADEGYRRPELWLSDGWYAVQENGWDAPLYWRDDGPEGWSVFTLAGRRPLDPNEPVVHVSHYEADAYARWCDARLPTEFEWERAVACSPAETLREVDDVAWQWTASAYLAYPRFRPAPGAVGEYNGKFMSGQMTLRGGAHETSPGHTRVTYRNFFPPASRWMFSGVRIASDVAREPSP
jgi:ergothioneine biosynthesis protein EgtB